MTEWCWVLIDQEGSWMSTVLRILEITLYFRRERVCLLHFQQAGRPSLLIYSLHFTDAEFSCEKGRLGLVT